MDNTINNEKQKASGSKLGKHENNSSKKLTFKSILLACLCSIFCAGAVSISISDEMFLIVDNSFQSYLVFIISALAFVYLYKRNALNFRLCVLVVSILLTLMMVAGFMLCSADTFHIVGIDLPGHISYPGRLVTVVTIAIMLLGYLIFYYLMVMCVYSKLCTLKVSKTNSGITVFGFDLDLKMCLMIMGVAWLPYIIIFFPGLPTSDTCRQMAQFYGTDGLILDTHFPYFMSAVYGGLFSFAHMIDPSGCLGLFLLMLSQVIPTLFLFSVIVLWVKSLNMPRWLVLASLGFFALFPLIPAYMMQTGKDTIHAVLLAFFVFQLLMLFCKKDHQDIPFKVLFSYGAIGVNALLISLSRNGSIIIVVVALLVVAFVLKRAWFAGVGAGVLVLFCVWQLAVLPACGVQNEGSREMLSMPAQIVAAHIHDDLSIDEDTKEQLNQYFGGNLDSIAEGYVSTWADPVKNYLTINSTGELFDFLKLSMQVALSAPVHSLGAALDTTYGAWYPFTYGTYYPEDAPYVMSQEDMWAHPSWIGSYYDYDRIYNRVEIPIKILKSIRVIPGISELYAPGFYTWLIILLIGFSFYTGKNRGRTIAVLLPFMMLILIMIAGPCASLRYALPMVFSIPLFMTMAVEGLRAKKDTQFKSIDAA